LQKQEIEATTARVEEDRRYVIDAGIVRIMKTRKKIKHTELISTLFQQLKFPLNVKLKKPRIHLSTHPFLPFFPNLI
jgi:hypothetical protein